MGVKTAAFRSTSQHLSRLNITRMADAELIKSQLLCQLSYAPGTCGGKASHRRIVRSEGDGNCLHDPSVCLTSFGLSPPITVIGLLQPPWPMRPRMKSLKLTTDDNLVQHIACPRLRAFLADLQQKGTGIFRPVPSIPSPPSRSLAAAFKTRAEVRTASGAEYWTCW